MIKLLNTQTTGLSPVDENILFEIVLENQTKTGLRLVRDRWAGADEYIYSLIGYLNTLKSAVDDTLLVKKCINEGLRVWRTSLDEDTDDKTRVAAFIRGTVHYLPEVLSWRVVWAEKPRVPAAVWNPYKVGLTREWREQNRNISWILKGDPQPEWANVSAVDFRSIILTKHLISDSTLMRSMAPNLGYLAGR